MGEERDIGVLVKELEDSHQRVTACHHKELTEKDAEIAWLKERFAAANRQPTEAENHPCLVGFPCYAARHEERLDALEGRLADAKDVHGHPWYSIQTERLREQFGKRLDALEGKVTWEGNWRNHRHDHYEERLHGHPWYSIQTERLRDRLEKAVDALEKLSDDWRSATVAAIQENPPVVAVDPEGVIVELTRQLKETSEKLAVAEKARDAHTEPAP